MGDAPRPNWRFRIERMANPIDSISSDPLRDDVVIVIPAFNESGAIGAVVAALQTRWPNVVVVDDGSSDDTGGPARDAGAIVLRHIINRGQGAALQTGIEFALRRGARIIVTFDADGQHDVDDVAALVDPITRGDCDITLGSRFLGRSIDMPASRRALLRLAIWFTRLTSRLSVTDAHNGLRAFSRRAAETIRLTEDRMAHASEIMDQIASSGLPYREVPVRVRYTEYSLAKGQRAGGAFRIILHYIVGRFFQ